MIYKSQGKREDPQRGFPFLCITLRLYIQRFYLTNPLTNRMLGNPHIYVRFRVLYHIPPGFTIFLQPIPYPIHIFTYCLLGYLAYPNSCAQNIIAPSSLPSDGCNPTALQPRWPMRQTGVTLTSPSRVERSTSTTAATH